MNLHEEPSKTVEWYTPPELVTRIEVMFGAFDLDPCATPESAKAPKFFTIADNALSRSWFGNVFMNPPYGNDIVFWVAKAAVESKRTEVSGIVALLPARTDTDWYHDFVFPNIDVLVQVHGRIRFLSSDGSPAGAPKFPSIIVRFRPRGFFESIHGVHLLSIEANPGRNARRKRTK